MAGNTTEIGEDKEGQVDTKEKVDSLFAKMLPYKPNFIKVWYVVKPGLTAEDSYPIIEYIGQKAHKAGLRYAVHATQLKTAQLAVKAGADILVHSIDDEIIPQDFIEKLNAVHKFPSVYMFKFIIPADNEKLAKVEGLFTSDESTLSVKQSKTGKFLSITAKELMMNPDRVIERYLESEEIGGVISL